MVLWIPKVIYIIIVLVVAFGLIYAFTSNEVDVDDVEAHVIMHSLHYSPEGISKVDDDTGRVYTGIVDHSRFKVQNIKNTLYATGNDQNSDDASDADEDALAMEVVKRNWDRLDEEEGCEEGDEEVCLHLNKDTYDKEIPLAIFKDKDYREIRYINYETSDSRDRAELETTVIMPNE